MNIDFNLRRYSFLSIILLMAVAFFLYGQVLGFEYVWDDHVVFENRPNLTVEDLNWQALSEPVLYHSSYFRPLVFLTLWGEYKLFDQDPGISHAINLLLFITNTILIFILGRKLALFSGKKNPVFVAFVASLLYIVHPALIESTVWVSGRFDIMATLFILAGSVVYLSALSKTIKNLLISLCMFLSLASKEIGIVLPIVLYCLWVATQAKPNDESPLQTLKRGLIENKIILTALIGVFVVYWLIRIQSMPDTFGGRFNIGYVIDAWFKEMLPLDTLRFYLIQTFLPFREVAAQHPIDDFLSSWGNFRVLGNILTLIFLVLLLAVAWMKRSISCWLFLAGLICLLPVLHFFPMAIDINIGNERFLTAPLAFWVLAIALIRYDLIFDGLYSEDKRYYKKKSLYNKALNGVLLSWIVFALMTTYSVIPLWRNNILLWGWTKQLYPNIVAVRYNYLLHAKINGLWDIVKEETAKIEKELETGSADISLVKLYMEDLLRADDPEALLYAKQVVSRIPPFHNILSSPKEIRSFQHDVPLQPRMIRSAYSSLSIATLLYEGDPDKAMEYNKIVYWYKGEERESAPLLYERLMILYALGRFDETVKVEDLSNKLHYPHVGEREGRRRFLKHGLSRYCVTVEMGGYCNDLIEKKIISEEDISILRSHDLKKVSEKQMENFNKLLHSPE
ncbi:MAG: hypothetical protein LBS40_07835 [Burkholderiales bacterium]|nr:hypothetical protein [Burkholderiales bacterium]